jgi:hypothetical protein
MYRTCVRETSSVEASRRPGGDVSSTPAMTATTPPPGETKSARRRHRGEPLDELTVERWGLARARVEQWLDDGQAAHYRLPWSAGHP